ncbi:BTH_I0359 family protein [Sphaerotilaceae bacterium SBD11-9]
MQMLYNSDNFVVVQFDVPGTDENHDTLRRGGYEIVDKFARKEIFIEGAMAESFKEGVAALIETSPSEEEMDDYIERYTSLMQHPLVLH